MKTEHALSRVTLSIFVVSLFLITGCDASSNDTRRRAREHACYANMRVLMGATELYNMDHDDKTLMHRLLPADYLSSSSRLISGKYLRRPINLPEKNCAYFVRGDLAEEHKKICCDVHGSPE